MKSILTRRVVAVPAILIATASAAAAATVMSTALFTDTQSVGTNTFTTGTIDVQVTPASTAITMAGMMPGDTVTAPLTVKNGGSDALRYALSTVATNTDAKSLAAGLTVNVKTGVTTCTNAGFATDGVSVVSGQTLASLAIGSNTQGAQAGDRSLAGGAQEVLCIQASLPTSAANTLQGATTTATFTVDAEQTKNN